MTNEQHLERIRLYGFTVVHDAMTPEQTGEARAAVEHLYATDPGVAAKRKRNTDLLHVENLPNKGKVFETFFLNPKVYPLAKELLGDSCILQDVWSFGVPPGGGGGSLHSDEPIPLASHVQSVVTVYPLVDFTPESGGTRVVPGSHLSNGKPDKDHYEGEINITAKAGSCIVFLGALWHGPGANMTKNTRTMYGAYFTVPWIKPYIDFTRSLSRDVLDRASPEVRRLYGFGSRVPHTERWQWDHESGRPKAEFVEQLRADRGWGDECL